MNLTSDTYAARAGGHPEWNSVSAARTLLQGKVFFAVKPDTRSALEAGRAGRLLRSMNGLTAGLRPPEVRHVTLLCLGRRPALRWEVIEAACGAATNVAMPPFEIAFDRAASFNGEYGRTSWPLVLYGGEGVIGVEMLQAALLSELGRIGFPTKRAGFEPHMTLLYDRKCVAEQFITLRVSWRVGEFLLIHSLDGYTRHVVLGRWTLRGRSPGRVV